MNKTLGFKYERKRITKEAKLPPLCKDYEPEECMSGRCKKAALCKNATYGWENEAFGSCYGGTKSSERDDKERKMRLAVQGNDERNGN